MLSKEREAQLAEAFAAAEANEFDKCARLMREFNITESEWIKFVNVAFFGSGRVAEAQDGA